MANHIRNFKKKGGQVWQKNVENSSSYQRYLDQIKNSTSPDVRAAPTGNLAEPSSWPVIQMRGGDLNNRSGDALSKEPPAPLFLVEAQPLWQACSSVRESNPLSGRVALYRASRLYAKYVLHVPDPTLDYCFALEEARFLETLQTIDILQQSGRSISEEKRHQILDMWEHDLLPIQEIKNDNQSLLVTSPACPQVSNGSTTAPTPKENGSEASITVKKHNRAIQKHQKEMQELENKLCKAMTAKEKAVSLLCKVRLSRNKQKEKTVAAKEELKEVKIKNTALGKQLSAEKYQVGGD